MGLVLQGAQLHQVIHPILVVLNVPVEHRGVRLQSDLVSDTRCFQPLAAVDLVVADDRAHPFGENFRSSSGHRLHPCLFHFQQRVAYGELGALGKKRNLHHGERLDVYLRKPLPEPANQIQKIFQRQIRMQAANDVKLRHRFRVARSRRLPSLLQSHCVGAGNVFSAAEGTQPASRNAYVGRVDVTVDIEVRDIAVHTLAHVVSQPADGENIARLVEGKAIFECQTFLPHHFIGDGQQPGIVCLKWAVFAFRDGHPLDDNAQGAPIASPCQDRFGAPGSPAFG